MSTNKVQVKVVIQTAHKGKSYGVGSIIQNCSKSEAEYLEKRGFGEIVKAKATQKNNTPV